MALAEKYYAEWRDQENVTQVVTTGTDGTSGDNPPSLVAGEGSFTLDWTADGLNDGRAINFGALQNAYNSLAVDVSFKISGAVDGSIDFAAGTANQITGTTSHSDGQYTIQCVLSLGYDHPEFRIDSTDALNEVVTFSQLKIQGNLHKVSLLLEGHGGGTTEIDKKQTPAWTVNRRGDKDLQLLRGIAGSEGQFNFHADDTDLAAFDAIFESNYKDWQVRHSLNATVDWYGWLLPENFSRIWIASASYYQYSLTATDGLAQLKQVEFSNFSTGDFYEDRVSLITIIKRCLEHIEIDLDFRIHLNSWVTNDTLMTSTDSVFEDVDSDSSRFLEDKEGRQVNTNCYEMIERILSPLNCYLMQVDSKYWIVNSQEQDSYYHAATWALSFSARTAQDLEIDINSSFFRLNPEMQKIRPFEAVQVTFRDRNVQDNLLTNGDFSSGTTDWTNNGYTGFVVVGGEGRIQYATADDPAYLAYAEKTVTATVENDQVHIEFDVKTTFIDYSVGVTNERPLQVQVKLYDQGATFIGETFIRNTSEEWVHISEDITVPSGTTGVNVRIFVTSNIIAGVDDSFTFIDNVSMNIIYQSADITFDKFYEMTNDDDSFVDIQESQLYFGDSSGDSDIGGFQISGTRSETWSREGKTEDVSIQVLYAQNIIENFQKYKNYVRCSIFDPDYEIKPYSLLLYDSRYYQIVSLIEVFAAGLQKELRIEMVEMLDSAVTTTVTSQDLSTSDGS